MTWEELWQEKATVMALCYGLASRKFTLSALWRPSNSGTVAQTRGLIGLSCYKHIEHKHLRVDF